MQKMQTIKNGRTGRNARSKSVVVERKKLPGSRNKPQKPPEEEKITGLFVNGNYKHDTDGETLIIPLSRRANREEQAFIKSSIQKECRQFVRTSHFKGPSIRIRIKHTSGETLCARQIHECVKEAVKSL